MELLDRTECVVYVGYADGAPVVSGLGWRTGRTIGVYAIAVPTVRRRGYGAAMTAHVVTDGLAAGCDVAVLQASNWVDRYTSALDSGWTFAIRPTIPRINERSSREPSQGIDGRSTPAGAGAAKEGAGVGWPRRSRATRSCRSPMPTFGADSSGLSRSRTAGLHVAGSLMSRAWTTSTSRSIPACSLQASSTGRVGRSGIGSPDRASLTRGSPTSRRSSRRVARSSERGHWHWTGSSRCAGARTSPGHGLDIRGSAAASPGDRR